MPIDFIYDAVKDSYDLEAYVTDEDIIKRVQEGLTEKQVYKMEGSVLPVNRMFAGTVPEFITQDKASGSNNLIKAKAAVIEYYFTTQIPVQGKFWKSWDYELIVALEMFNFNSKHVKA